MFLLVPSDVWKCLEDLLDGVLLVLSDGGQVEGGELTPLEPHEGVHDEAGGDVVVPQELLCCMFRHLLTDGFVTLLVCIFSASLVSLEATLSRLCCLAAGPISPYSYYRAVGLAGGARRLQTTT